MVKGSLTLSACLLPVAGWALTLNDALRWVLAENPSLQAGREQVSVLEARQRKSFADFLPDVTASGDYYIQQQDTGGATTTHHPLTGTVAVSQPLFRGGASRAAYRGAEANTTAQEYAYQSSVQTLFLQTVQAYMALLAAQTVYQQQSNLVEVLAKTLQATQRRFQLGDGTKTDVAQAEARLAGAKAGLMQAEAALTTSRQDLAALIGEKPAQEELVWPVSSPVALPKDVDKALAEAMDIHPDLLAALAELTSAKHGVTEAKSGYWPEVDATASVTRAENTTSGDYTNQQVGVTVSVPLYRGGATKSDVKEAVHTQAAAQASYESTRRAIMQEVYNAVTAHQVALTSQTAYEAAVEAAALAATGVTKEEELGTRSTLDVLNAQQELLDAQVDLTEAKANTVTTAYRLLAAVGRLTEIPALEPAPQVDPVVVEKMAP